MNLLLDDMPLAVDPAQQPVLMMPMDTQGRDWPVQAAPCRVEMVVQGGASTLQLRSTIHWSREQHSPALGKIKVIGWRGGPDRIFDRGGDRKVVLMREDTLNLSVPLRMLG